MREGEPRSEKVAVVDEVRERLSSSSATLLTEYRGLKVGELAELRRNLRSAGGDFKIYKNTLVRFAVRDLGIEIDEAMLTGPTAVAFVDGDAAAVAKALRDYSRTNPNLVLKGGVLGTKALTAEQTTALAELPSREVLLAQLAGALQAPMAKLAGLLQAMPRNLAYGLKALVDQKIAAGEEVPAPAEAPAADDPAAEAPADEQPVAEESADETPAAEAPAEADVSENEAAADAVVEEASEAPAAEAETTTEETAEPAEAPAEASTQE